MLYFYDGPTCIYFRDNSEEYITVLVFGISVFFFFFPSPFSAPLYNLRSLSGPVIQF